jgi:hypothetical protein
LFEIKLTWKVRHHAEQEESDD